MKRPALDVSALPTFAFGPSDSPWWAAMSVVAIESTMYALLFASYLYIRQQYETFPPTPIPRAVLVVGTIALAAVLLSAWPMHLVCKHALTADVPRMRLWLIVNTALAIAVVVLRIVELRWLTFRWDSHAHGSAVWSMLGLHLFHAATGVLENFVFLALLFTPWRLEKKHLPDLRLNGLYWYFVVGAFVVIYALVFLDPALFARHSGP
jgi:cytochrome c oxidase subunit III